MTPKDEHPGMRLRGLRFVLDLVTGIGAVLIGLWFVLDSFRR